jgi:hypothetical protein
VRTALVFGLAHEGDLQAAAREAATLPNDYRSQALILLAGRLAQEASTAEIVAVVEDALETHATAAVTTEPTSLDAWMRIIERLAADDDVDRTLDYLKLHPGESSLQLAQAFVRGALAQMDIEELQDVVDRVTDGRLRGHISREIVIATARNLVRQGAVGDAARFVAERWPGQGLEAIVAVAMAERGDVELALAVLETGQLEGEMAREARVAMARALTQRGAVQQALEQADALSLEPDEQAAFTQEVVVAIAETLVQLDDAPAAAQLLLNRLPTPYAASSELARLVTVATPEDGEDLRGYGAGLEGETYSLQAQLN